MACIWWWALLILIKWNLNNEKKKTDSTHIADTQEGRQNCPLLYYYYVCTVYCFELLGGKEKKSKEMEQTF